MTLREHVTVHVAPAALRERATCLLLRRVEGPPGGQLHSAVHANPYACLNVLAAGRVRSGTSLLPRLFLCGPLSAPLGTTAHGGLVSCSLVFPPWLLAPVFSCAADAVADGLREVRALPHALAQRLEMLFDGEDAAPSRIDRLWQEWDVLTRGHAAPDLAQEIVMGQGVAAAAARLGCSARHYRRRFREAMGLAPAVWSRLVRWEQALGGLAQGRLPSLSDVALAAGYADQAHLTRETRALAGEPPARLREAMLGEDGHWSLAPARVRFVQDASPR